MKSAAALLTLLFLTAPAHAGNSIFPPDNIGNNPNSACPNGSVLRWMGNRVDCADPTGGVNLACPSGYVLQGISYGQPVCVELPTSCSTTTNGSSSSTSTSTSVSTSGSGSASAKATSNSGSSTSSSHSGTNVVVNWR